MMQVQNMPANTVLSVCIYYKTSTQLTQAHQDKALDVFPLGVKITRR